MAENATNNQNQSQQQENVNVAQNNGNNNSGESFWKKAGKFALKLTIGAAAVGGTAYVSYRAGKKVENKRLMAEHAQDFEDARLQREYRARKAGNASVSNNTNEF